MTKLEMLKIAINLTVGIGTSTIVNQTVKNNTNPQNLLQKVAMGSASVVLGAMAADQTKSYVNEQIDALEKTYKTAKNA